MGNFDGAKAACAVLMMSHKHEINTLHLKTSLDIEIKTPDNRIVERILISGAHIMARGP
jgi:hypothetical protein